MLTVICLFLISGAVSFPFSCEHACDADYTPVCGSDGTTYSNTCELSNTNCRAIQHGLTVIGLVHKGQCNSGNALVEASTCDKICDEERSPLCASNGVVYENRCLYNIAQCIAAQNGTYLKVISYTSTCPIPTKPECEKYARNTSDLAIEGPLGASIRTVCHHAGHEVCTNHGTVKSECHLCQTIESNLEKLQHYPGYHVLDYQILYDGPCLSSSSHRG